MHNLGLIHTRVEIVGGSDEVSVIEVPPRRFGGNAVNVNSVIQIIVIIGGSNTRQLVPEAPARDLVTRPEQRNRRESSNGLEPQHVDHRLPLLVLRVSPLAPIRARSGRPGPIVVAAPRAVRIRPRNGYPKYIPRRRQYVVVTCNLFLGVPHNRRQLQFPGPFLFFHLFCLFL